MRTQQVVVIGAGVGGLAAAIALAGRGVDVTVLERATGPGGKMRTTEIAGAHIDVGPTVLTMRWVFEDLFASAGASLDRHVNLTPLDILARHAWDAGPKLDLHASLEASADAIGAFAGAAEARGFLAFMAEARRIYDVLRAPFLEASRPTPFSLASRIGVGRLADLLAIRPFDTVWSALRGHFEDPRLCQLFGRYATYCGSSPFKAPATLMLIAHVEQAGVWTVEGGMGALAGALHTLAQKLGVTFRFDAHVSDIQTAHGRVAGVTLQDGERRPADAVIVNGDPSALGAGAFGAALRRAAPMTRPAARSLSAITWALNASSPGFALSRHNVFFSPDYAAEFRDLLTHRRPPTDPTVYVCAQDRPGDHTGAERLLLLINAPAHGDTSPLRAEERAACEARTFDRLRRCGLTIESDSAQTIQTTPAEFAALYPATGGALYGRATHGWASAFQRPGARTAVPGLYLAGGGTHPGAGVPMAALSGRLAAQSVLADLVSMRPSRPAVSTRPSRPGAMSGGTSTRSATTAATASRSSPS